MTASVWIWIVVIISTVRTFVIPPEHVELAVSDYEALPVTITVTSDTRCCPAAGWRGWGADSEVPAPARGRAAGRGLGEARQGGRHPNSGHRHRFYRTFNNSQCEHIRYLILSACWILCMCRYASDPLLYIWRYCCVLLKIFPGLHDIAAAIRTRHSDGSKS